MTVIIKKNTNFAPAFKGVIPDEHTGCSVVRSSRLLWEQEVAGSNPATPTKGSVAQLDRATAF